AHHTGNPSLIALYNPMQANSSGSRRMVHFKYSLTFILRRWKHSATAEAVSKYSIAFLEVAFSPIDGLSNQKVENRHLTSA
ncbi:hypothetical protein PMAYCL1PPCAC_22861, partial [Pristionchus mayeri]